MTGRSEATMHHRGGRALRAAFTLIEVLVVVAVIAVLIAIILPSLRGARVSAGRTTMLSNLRGIGVIFEVYTQTYAGEYPFHDPEDWYQMSPPGEAQGGILSTSDPWAMRANWPCVFHAVAPWREHYRSWMNDGRRVNEAVPWLGDDSNAESGMVSYTYSCSFHARPETWPVGDPAPGNADDLLAVVRTSELLAPSAKVLCFDHDRAYLRRDARRDDPRGVLAADGSALGRLDAHAMAPVQNRINDRTPERYLDTQSGVRGRDF